MDVHLGWHVPGLSIHEVIQGITHVDDSLVISKIFCPDCLLAGVLELFPKDVGVSEEGRPPSTRFLTAFIVTSGEQLSILPFSQSFSE